MDEVATALNQDQGHWETLPENISLEKRSVACPDAGYDDLDQEIAARSKIRRWVKPAIGYLLAAAGLSWVLRDLEPSHLKTLLANFDPRWIAMAVVCDVASYVCQGVRWRLLLRSLGEISTPRSTQAIYAGLFANEILPVRVGEIVRAYLVARRLNVKLVSVVPSMMVERLFDCIWLAAGIGLTAIFVPLPVNLVRAADLLGVSVVLAALALVYFIAQPPKLDSMAGGPMGFIQSLVSRASENLRRIAQMREFYLSLIVSLFLLGFQALAFWLVMRGCGMTLSLWIGVAVFLIVHLGTAIPNAPANIGSYQFFTVLGLTLFGVEKGAATGFSLVVFVLLTLPLLVIGGVAMSASGTGLLSIRREYRDMDELG